MHCTILLFGLVLAGDVPFPDWRSEMLGDRPLPASVGQPLTADELARLAQGQPLTPYAELTAGVRGADGTLWVGSPRGLMHLAPGQKRWRLFHSRRWLPDDHVLDLAAADDGSIWVRTRAGTGRLFTRSITLDAKVAEVHSALREHHVWKGLVKDIVLNRPGDVTAGYAQPSSDNDGLWTSLYVAAEAFRYGVTGDPEAKRNAWESLQALMFLEKISGIPGFVARSYVPREEGDPAKRHGGEWHPSADGKWWWKGDTSSDEVVGHYFAYAVYYDVAATEDEKRQIRPVVARITDHIIDHGFYYVGPPGKPTTWGVWAPEQLNRNLRRAGDRGLNSLEVLSHLKVAEHVTGRPRYAAAAHELDEKHGYAINTILQKMDWPAELVNHSDDELAFLAYYPLLRYERDERRRAIYLLSLERSWHIERPEGSPLWNFIYATGRQASRWTKPSERPPEAFISPERYDRAICLEWFRDVPVDTIRWSVRNSDRRDVAGRAANRFRRSRAMEVLPIAERMMLRWNADPYELDQQADGRERGDGVFILLPYWLGRYHRLLVDAILAQNPAPPGADPKLVQAVRKIDELRGQLEFDAQGRLVGVDLAGDRVSISDADVPMLSALPNLRRLRLSGSGITAAGVEQISSIGGLTELALLGAQIDNSGLARLTRLRNLTSLTLQRSAVLGDDGLDHLKRLPKLTHLGLLNLNISDRGVARLAELVQLRLLDLRGSSQVTSAGLAQLTALKNLKALRLGGYQVDDATLALAKSFPALTSLTIDEASITGTGLAHLRGLPLEELVLFRCQSVTDDALRPLDGLPGLRQLSLRDMPILGEGLAHLGGKPKLAVLRLNETDVGDAGLEHLKDLKPLVRLELRRTQTSDAGLKTLAALASLEHLDLENTRITDAGLAELARLERLQWLNLDGNPGITDAAVDRLAAMRCLKTLSIAQTGVTDEGAKRLSDAMPWCAVKR